MKRFRPSFAAALDRAKSQARQQVQSQQLLHSHAYRLFRKRILAERPICEDCGWKAAKEVHHVRKLALHPEDLVDDDQVRALCKGCHSKKTVRGE